MMAVKRAKAAAKTGTSQPEHPALKRAAKTLTKLAAELLF